MAEKAHRIPNNFCGLPEEFSSWRNSRVVIIPVPYDLTSTYVSGSRSGPRAIINASMNMEQFDEELKTENFRIGIHTQEQLETIASSPEPMMAAIEGAVEEVLAADKFPVLLGGEHSITIGALRAVRKKHRRISILHFDAHADLRDSYQGTSLSHACAGRRASEMGRLVQVGIRSLSAEEEEFRSKSEVRTFFAADLASGRAHLNEIISSIDGDLYITIDLDVFDPSIVPATGTPEPGGLTWYDVTGILRAACEGRRVVGMDVVELCPIMNSVASDFLAAKLVYRAIGYVFSGELARIRERKLKKK
ncbi:MAG: agmatinase [Candidatus Aureabacteria bacterium]|nr:agmatinase [Candidatus Auribacterota bacterium]